MDEFQKLEKVIAEARTDADKFFNRGNNAAGTRLRAHMQTIKQLAQSVRINVSEARSSEQ